MKSLKTPFYFSSLLLVAASAQGQWEPNVLVGVSGGYVHTSGNLDVVMTPPAPIAGTSFTTELENNRWLWGVLAGYQAKCDRWLLGAEVNVDWIDRKNTQNYAFTDATGTGWTAAANFRRDPTVALTGRLGYALSEFFMPYVRLGAETSRDKFIYNASSSTGLLVSEEGSRRSYRFVGGIGAEMPVPSFAGLSFRLEYNYHSPGRAINASAPASDGVTLVATGTKQKANVAKASLVWNFF